MDEGFGTEGSLGWVEKESMFHEGTLDELQIFRMIEEESYNSMFHEGTLNEIQSLRMIEEESRPRPRDWHEEQEPYCKRQKVDSCSDMTKKPSRLGLTLHKTPSFLELIDTALRQEKTTPLNDPMVSTRIAKQKTRNDKYDTKLAQMKLKASNFPATKLKIGSWERESRNEGDIVAKFYYAKRKIVWEILEKGLKLKLEIQWADISAIRARFIKDQPAVLEVELGQQPLFFTEINPQPRKHTNWEARSDFTGQNATIYRHYLEFPEGTLEKHYKRLLHNDCQLFAKSQRAFTSHDSPCFENISREMHDISILEQKFPPLFNQPSSNWYLPHLHHMNNQERVNVPTYIRTSESVGPSVVASHSFSVPKPTAGARDMNSPSSVLEYPPTMDQAAGALNLRKSYLDNFVHNNVNSTLNPIPSSITQFSNQETPSLQRIDDTRESQTQQLSLGACATPAPNFLSVDCLLSHAAETESFHLPIQDFKSIEEQLFKELSDLVVFAPNKSMHLSEVTSIGSLNSAAGPYHSRNPLMDWMIGDHRTDGTNFTFE